MAKKTFNQKFNGYLRESKISLLPAKSGVYGVYSCIYTGRNNKVNLKELLYIGKADDLNGRIKNHEDWDDWDNELQKWEQICFCYTLVEDTDNERVEAALINSNQPKLNKEYIDSFPFDETIVNCFGNHEYINKKNIVPRH